ncbi:MAG: acyl-CoA dehydrogenase family protein [Pseudomonadota bacterium]
MLLNSGALMRFGLPPEIDELRDAVRRVVEDKVAPLAAEVDRSNKFPRHLWPELGELGLFGITVAEEHGGMGLGYLAHVVVNEEMSRGSASIGLSYGAHSNLCLNQLQLNATEAQKEKYLPKLLSGEHVGALAMSEHGAGSDVVAMALKAERVEGGFRLNGTKMWITNGPHADVLIVYAKTDPDKGPHGITAFIVEKSFEGFSASPKLDKLGMRGSDTSELVFNGCFVPQENVLGKVNGGVAVLMSGLDYERVILGAGALGIMEASLDAVMPYIHDRKQFGQPIGQFQLLQGKVADMYTSLVAARALVYAAAAAADRGELTRHDAAAAFLFAGEGATRVATDAVQLMGGNGYMNDSVPSRLLRDAKLCEIGGGTSEVRRLLIGRELFNRTG